MSNWVCFAKKSVAQITLIFINFRCIIATEGTENSEIFWLVGSSAGQRGAVALVYSCQLLAFSFQWAAMAANEGIVAEVR